MGIVKASAIALIAMCGLPALAEGSAKDIMLPSGLKAGLQEMLWDRPGHGLVYRFRFVAPEFTGDEAFETIRDDMEFLCNSYALPKLSDVGPQPSQVIISLADQPSVFGEFDPDVVQVFEAYAVEDGNCIWEVF